MTAERVKKSLNKSDNRHRSQEVAAFIEQSVLAGNFTAGQRLPSEAAFCAEYNVSRTVVREALKHLAGQGIINTKNGSGSYVTAGNTENLGNSLKRIAAMANDSIFHDMLELRVMLESACAAKLARSRNMKEIRKLFLPLELMHQATESGDIDSFIQADVEFHRTIIESSGNALILEIQKAIEVQIVNWLTRRIVDSSRLRSAFSEHAIIAETIREGDGEKTAQLIAMHIYRATGDFQRNHFETVAAV